MEACVHLLADGTLKPLAQKSLEGFINLIKKNSEAVANENSKEPLRIRIENYIKNTGLIDALKAEQTTEADTRIENIKEFFSVAEEFTATHDEDEMMFDAPCVEDAKIVEKNSEPERTLRGNSLPDFLE